MNYLTEEVLLFLHGILAKNVKGGEPLPPFTSASREAIDSLIKTPQSSFFGVEQYPTIQEKAAIIFYTVNKKHLFENGNKRMSVACLLMFLLLNDSDLNVAPDELTQKALWLAMTTHEHNFDEIKQELSSWILAHMKAENGDSTV